MTKVIVTLSVFLLLVLFAIGGVYVYKTMTPPVQEAVADDSAEDPAKNSKGPLGRMKTAKATSDVPGLLTYAMEKNLDAVGWLEVPGTDISQVIMQGNDNVYYERRDEDGNDNIYGCYFMDVECSLGKRSDFLPNTIIYGHSDLKDNPDGPRFSQLFRFTEDNFAKENKYMYLTTLQGRYTFEIFSVFYTDTKFDYIRVHMTDEETIALASKAKKLSIRDYGIEPIVGDKLLTLSTCSVRDGNDGTHRFVIMGRLIDEEAVTVPESVSSAEKSESVAETTKQETSSAVSEASSSKIQQPGNIQPIIPEMQPTQIAPIAPIIPEQPQMPQQPVIPGT